MSISKIKVGSVEHDLQASTVVRNVTDNTDVNIWKVYSDIDGEYGFRLQYDASGTGNDNSLSLVADNQTGTEVVAMKMLQDGTTTFAKTIAASISGNASTATKAMQDASGNVITATYAKKNHTHSVTAAGTIGNTLITPAGTVSRPTFTGTGANHNHTFTGSAVNSSTES